MVTRSDLVLSHPCADKETRHRGVRFFVQDYVINKEKGGEFKPKTPSPRAHPLTHPPQILLGTGEGRTQVGIFCTPVPPSLPLPPSCHMMSYLRSSLCLLYFPLSAFPYPVLPCSSRLLDFRTCQGLQERLFQKIPRSWTGSDWPSLGHIAAPGSIDESSRAPGHATHSHG